MKKETLKKNIVNIAKIKQLIKKLNFKGNREAEFHILDIETCLTKLQLILFDEREINRRIRK